MNDFSLSRARDKVLPEMLKSENGNTYSIDADFRTVLRCIRVCSDDDVCYKDALCMVMVWFFKGAFVPDAMELFCGFLGAGSDPEDDAKMDFEQDADAIYASFLMDYGIDLFDVPFLHWRKFCTLLAGLSERSALMCRIQLREFDTTHLKGREKAKVEKAKRRVQLVERLSAEEEALRLELEKALAEGKDPAAVLEKLKNS